MSLGDLPDALRCEPESPKTAASCFTPAASEPVGDPEESEVWRICEALKKHRNNRVRAASELGMSRVSLYKKLHKYGLFEKNTISG